jgi:hypothetical protein
MNKEVSSEALFTNIPLLNLNAKNKPIFTKKDYFNNHRELQIKRHE